MTEHEFSKQQLFFMWVDRIGEWLAFTCVGIFIATIYLCYDLIEIFGSEAVFGG